MDVGLVGWLCMVWLRLVFIVVVGMGMLGRFSLVLWVSVLIGFM